METFQLPYYHNGKGNSNEKYQRMGPRHIGACRMDVLEGLRFERIRGIRPCSG